MFSPCNKFLIQLNNSNSAYMIKSGFQLFQFFFCKMLSNMFAKISFLQHALRKLRSNNWIFFLEFGFRDKRKVDKTIFGNNFVLWRKVLCLSKIDLDLFSVSYGNFNRKHQKKSPNPFCFFDVCTCSSFSRVEVTRSRENPRVSHNK